MYPPIFQLCTASAAVTALLGTGPTRLFPAGEAPQGVALPYAAWQTITGLPENNLDCRPDADTWSVQIDVYAKTLTAARAAAAAIRDAIEPSAYVTSWRGESRDPDTNNYRYSFDVDVIVTR